MSLVAAAAILSCGLTATPDGIPVPKGSVAALNAPIPDEFARTLATKVAPEPRIRFAGEAMATPEWIIGMKRESDAKFMVARLTYDLLAYAVRIGWVEVQPDGTNRFAETSKGTCQLKAADAPAQRTSR